MKSNCRMYRVDVCVRYSPIAIGQIGAINRHFAKVGEQPKPAFLEMQITDEDTEYAPPKFDLTSPTESSNSIYSKRIQK